jgi:hypothetical protein
MTADLFIPREIFTVKSSIGKLFINGKYFCWTLEDVIRGENIKIHKETGLPAGDYLVRLKHSPRFKRILPIIYTEPDELSVRKGGINFKFSLMHGGNTHLHTDGCILVAYNKIDDDTIQGTAEKALVTELQKYEQPFNLKIVNNNKLIA